MKLLKPFSKTIQMGMENPVSKEFETGFYCGDDFGNKCAIQCDVCHVYERNSPSKMKYKKPVTHTESEWKYLDESLAEEVNEITVSKIFDLIRIEFPSDLTPRLQAACSDSSLSVWQAIRPILAENERLKRELEFCELITPNDGDDSDDKIDFSIINREIDYDQEEQDNNPNDSRNL